MKKLVISAALGALLAATAARAEPPPAAALDEAKALFRKGVAELEAGDAERALDLFLQSRALVPSVKNTVDAAICLDRLGRFDEALDMYEELMARYPKDLPDDVRAAVIPAMAALRGRIGTLQISANVDGATVYVDGQARARLPLHAPLRVRAGAHRLRLLKDGYEPFEAPFEVAASGARTVEARLRLLDKRGQLRVEVPGAGGEVLVDGVVVGPAPWEGTLPPRRYLVATRRGDTGSPPVPVVVLESQVSLVRLTTGPLGAPARISADPATAEITVDDVVLGAGAQQVRVAPGSHRLVVAEPGYRTQSVELVVPAAGGPELRQHVRLLIDPAHPRWPRRPAGSFWIGAHGGWVGGRSLGGTAPAACPADCTGAPTAQGGLVGLRAGYRFPSGLSVEATSGYLTLSSSFSRSLRATFLTAGATGYDQHPIAYELAHAPHLRGFLAGLGGSVRRPLTARLAFVARATVGVVFASSADATTGTAAAGGQVLGAAVVDTATGRVSRGSTQSTPLFVWPEAALEVDLRPLRLGATLGGAFFPIAGPTLPAREIWALGAGRDPAHPAAAANAPHLALPTERAYGPFAIAAPQVFVEYPF